MMMNYSTQLLTWCLVLFTTCVVGGHPKSCKFPAIYVFGGSSSDTGAAFAAFDAVHPPYGETFFGDISGRFCDGRLIIDFIAEELELPYLDSYLNSLGSNYRYGANFAVGGSAILKYIESRSPFYLEVQISQFKVFKYHATVLRNKHSSNRRKPPSRSVLPKPDEFSRALYILDIGHNDIDHGFTYGSAEELRSQIPNITKNFYQGVQLLYNEGARIFWIHNTDPYGCMPRSVIAYKSKKGSFDANGCVKHQNEIALEFNRQLKERVFELRREFTDGKFTYVDVYAVKYKLIRDSKKEGFVDPMLFCCGTYDRFNLTCGRELNGPICKNASQYISWDSIHYTEAANSWVAKHILSGSFSDPPLPITNACF